MDSTGTTGGRTISKRITFVGSLLVTAFLFAPLSEAQRYRWRDYDDKAVEWFASDEANRIASNILTYQGPHGGFTKNDEMVSKPYDGAPADLYSTFDNGATYGQLPFIAHMYWATEDRTYADACIRVIDYILSAQYPNGGFPQRYPLRSRYSDHITFNDDAMIGVVRLLQTVIEDEAYAFIGQDRLRGVHEAWERGLSCILNAQVVVDGRKTVWCAQHDAGTLEPRGARSYEHPSLSGAESAGILTFLMDQEDPSEEIADAVNAGAAWFEGSGLVGIRLERTDDDRIVVKDPDASPVWARFYEIGSNRPIFSGRDGVIKYSLAEIEHERRNGYSWYGGWGRRVADRYAAWLDR
ncbi:pectate lyase [Candidatus Poribacteria bacterium]|nr:pectate lyase [Candidatus Poribacteria bacterium]